MNLTFDFSFVNMWFLLAVGLIIFLAATRGTPEARGVVLTIGCILLWLWALSSGNVAFVLVVFGLSWLAAAWQRNAIPAIHWGWLVAALLVIGLVWFFWPLISKKFGTAWTGIQNMRGGVMTTLPEARVGDLIPGMGREPEASEFRRIAFRVRKTGAKEGEDGDYIWGATIRLEGGPIGNGTMLDGKTWKRELELSSTGKTHVHFLVLPGQEYTIRAEFLETRSGAIIVPGTEGPRDKPVKYWQSGDSTTSWNNIFETDRDNRNYHDIACVPGGP